MARYILVIFATAATALPVWSTTWEPGSSPPQPSKICRAAGEIAVLVNRENSVRQISGAEVRTLFDPSLSTAPHDLVHPAQWPGGTPVQYAVSPNSEVCSNFFTMVRGGACDDIVSRWQHSRKLGSVNAVNLMESDGDVIRFVTLNPGAIGLISRKTLYRGARRLRVYGFCKNGF